MGTHAKRTRWKKALRLAAIPVTLGLLGGLFAAVSGSPSPASAASGQLTRAQLDATVTRTLGGTERAACVSPKNGDVAWFEISNVPHACADNLLLITWGVQGPAGAKGTNGTNGTAGVSGITEAAATTAVTDWPEGSGWGTDSFTRDLNETVQQVNNSHCNGAPACYEVFGTLTDSAGSTVPADGHASPNGSSTDTITAANIQHIAMSGQADFEFYSTSGKASGANVPATANGSQKSAALNTTDWGELAFPAGTQFFGVDLTQYDWTYTASVSYVNNGTSVSCTQTWNDQINPGDDGQGATDGNVTGVCPVS